MPHLASRGAVLPQDLTSMAFRHAKARLHQLHTCAVASGAQSFPHGLLQEQLVSVGSVTAGRSWACSTPSSFSRFNWSVFTRSCSPHQRKYVCVSPLDTPSGRSGFCPNLSSIMCSVLCRPLIGADNWTARVCWVVSSRARRGGRNNGRGQRPSPEKPAVSSATRCSASADNGPFSTAAKAASNSSTLAIPTRIVPIAGLAMAKRMAASVNDAA